METAPFAVAVAVSFGFVYSLVRLLRGDEMPNIIG